LVISGTYALWRTSQRRLAGRAVRTRCV